MIFRFFKFGHSLDQTVFDLFPFIRQGGICLFQLRIVILQLSDLFSQFLVCLGTGGGLWRFRENRATKLTLRSAIQGWSLGGLTGSQVASTHSARSSSNTCLASCWRVGKFVVGRFSAQTISYLPPARQSESGHRRVLRGRSASLLTLKSTAQTVSDPKMPCSFSFSTLTAYPTPIHAASQSRPRSLLIP